jgi:hypothetical protein
MPPRPTRFPVPFRDFLRFLIKKKSYPSRLLVFRRFLEEEAQWLHDMLDFKSLQSFNIGTREARKAMVEDFISVHNDIGVSEYDFVSYEERYLKWQKRCISAQRKIAAQGKWKKHAESANKKQEPEHPSPNYSDIG